MELITLLANVETELEMRQSRIALQLLIEERHGGRSKPLEEFLIGFVRTGVHVARSVARAAERKDAGRAIKSFAAALAGVWSDPNELIPDKGVIAGRLDDAYLTLRCFMTGAEATTQAAIEAKARCEVMLLTVGGYVGVQRMARLDAQAQALLASKRIRTIKRDMKGGRSLMAAWRCFAELPSVPKAKIDLSPPAYARAMRRAETAAQPPQPKSEEGHLYNVWFGTNRAPVDPIDLGKGFADERDSNGTVYYGTCSVEIPRTHKFGSTGTPFWKRWLRLEFTDDHLKLRKIATIASENEFLALLREELESQAEAERAVLVYLHGYNTSFEEAALRAAQIGFDLKVPGAMAFYSWPSMADVKGYFADIARVEASEKQIAEFLTAIATRTGAGRVHVIAHSMGNRGFARAISRITSFATATGGVRFGQIILAAPDLDVDLFRQLAIAYPKISDRTTMYVSAKDKALTMSSWLQNSDRAGFTPPVTVLDGIDTVEVTNIDLTLLGHGYFAEAEPVLYDIKELIDASRPPEKRMRIHAKSEAGLKFWAISA